MQIESVEIYLVALPWKRPQTTAHGPTESLQTVLVKMSSDGVSGWGEASPGNAPGDCGEWTAGAFALLRDWLAPTVVGQQISSGENLRERLAPFAQSQFAKGALDAAWWDLKARTENVPLHSVLGADRTEVEARPTLDRMEPPVDFLAQLGRYIDAGFENFKLMIRPGWAVEMLRAVRQDYPAARLQADCAGGLTLDRMDTFYRFEDFMLDALEQPLPPDDLVGHAMLQESMRTPICLDEGVRSLLQAEMALDMKSCRKINLHAPRVGGLTEALAIWKACAEAEIPCLGGSRPQSGIGTRIDLALACLISGDQPADFFDAAMLADDLAAPLVPQKSAKTGRMTMIAAAGAGIGVEPDRDQLKALASASATVGR